MHLQTPHFLLRKMDAIFAKKYLMQKFAFWMAYPFLFLVSLLPFRVTYILSDIFAVLLYHVIGYRKKLVIKHLKMVFPDYTEQQIQKIAFRSYQHFCDMFLELNKGLTSSEEEIQKRFVVTNPEFIQELAKKHSKIILMYAHYATYEWTVVLQHYTKIDNYIVYKKINQPYFDLFVNKIRTKFGAKLVVTSDTFKVMKKLEKDPNPATFGFVADQSPVWHLSKFWTTFFGVEVPVHVGAEEIAKKMNLPIVYMKVEKIKRGYYQASFEMMTESPKDFPNYALSEAYIRKVEQQILEAPVYYLWTHNRWKHAGTKPKHLQ